MMREEPSNGSLPAAQRTTAKTILVVEDDEDTQGLLTCLFSSIMVYHCQLATNASQAVHFVQRVTPDLFIVIDSQA